MLCNQRTHNPKQPTPEARQTARGASDWRGERLGSPAVQNGIEHALEKVLHDVQPDVASGRVYGAEDEDGGCH